VSSFEYGLSDHDVPAQIYVPTSRRRDSALHCGDLSDGGSEVAIRVSSCFKTTYGANQNLRCSQRSRGNSGVSEQRYVNPAFESIRWELIWYQWNNGYRSQVVGCGLHSRSYRQVVDPQNPTTKDLSGLRHLFCEVWMERCLVGPILDEEPNLTQFRQLWSCRSLEAIQRYRMVWNCSMSTT